MTCTKIPYRSQVGAWRAIRRIKEKDTGQTPMRSYWCGEHKAFHITSKPKPKPRRRR